MICHSKHCHGSCTSSHYRGGKITWVSCGMQPETMTAYACLDMRTQALVRALLLWDLPCAAAPTATKGSDDNATGNKQLK